MPSWPADQIERRSVDSLTPYARNSRTHSEAQIAQLVASIREFGFTNPVLVAEDATIIAGHGRVLAAKAAGLADVPVMVARGWSEAQIRAYVLADNKLALNAGWDDTILATELAELGDLGFDLSLTGFSPLELDALLIDKTEGLTDPDDVPEPPANPVSEAGDVWVLGLHRLACGSSTDAQTVEAVLGMVKPHLMVTDPPYGVEYDPEWRAEFNNDGPNSKRAVGKVLNDDRADWREAWDLFPGDVAYVWHGERQLMRVGQDLEQSGFQLRNLIVWGKSQLVFGRGNYHSQHETCWYAVRGRGHWTGDRKQTTLWQIPKPAKSETGHSTQKPVECMKRPIENNSSPGQAVYEPFSGSGTTIIAAEMTGRSCLAVELSPSYVDVAVQRWQSFTGRQAVLESTAETFAEVAAYRTPAAAKVA